MTGLSVSPRRPLHSGADFSARARFQPSSGSRLLMTVDAAGGVWRYAMELARGLKPLGFNTVFAGQGPAPSPSQRAEAEEAGDLVWIDGPLDWMAGSEAELSGFPAALSASIEEWRADIVHLNYPSQACGLLVNAPVVAVSHSCVASWWQIVKGTSLPPEWRWQARRQREGLHRADAIVAPSVSHSELLRGIYGALPQIHVVPNAISAVSPDGAKDALVFAAARWWDEGKNAGVLDRAAAALSWPVFMAGPTDGPGGQHVEIEHAANEDLPYAELLRRVGRAGIFVSPSLYEPFGLAALEAARAGAALVLSDIPTYRELWRGAALFFDPRDAGDLAARIEQLIANPPLRAALGRVAAARSLLFTPEIQARKMAGIYGDLLERARPQAVLERFA
ncbi:MAG: glycosyltransferase family 4 protein [Rhizobiaceae bacterium]